jgi:hypothetical protein
MNASPAVSFPPIDFDLPLEKSNLKLKLAYYSTPQILPKLLFAVVAVFLITSQSLFLLKPTQRKRPLL